MTSAAVAIMPSGATGLADRLRSSVTEADPVTTAEVAGQEAAREAFTAEAAALEVEGAVVAGELHFRADD
jgi:hypothetical protein